MCSILTSNFTGCWLAASVLPCAPDGRAASIDALGREVLQPVQALGKDLEQGFVRGQPDIIAPLGRTAAEARALAASHQHHTQPSLQATWRSLCQSKPVMWVDGLPLPTSSFSVFCPGVSITTVRHLTP